MSLRNAGLEWPPGIDGKTAARIYSFALKGLPGEALKSAVMKIIRGEFESIGRYMPTPPQLAVMVRMEARPLLDARARARETLESLSAGRAESVKDPAAVARVRDLARKVRDDAAELRDASVRGSMAFLPISHEQAETYQRILDLPDRAGAVDAEVLAYRRRVQSRIDTAEQPIPPQDEPVQGRYFLAQQQQEEMENDSQDQTESRSQGEDRRDFHRGSEGQQDGSGRDDGV